MSPVTCPLSVRAVSRGLPLRPSFPRAGPPIPRPPVPTTENNHRTMVDLEYQLTHPCGACSLCGGDVDNVRTRSDDDTDKDDDDADAPSVASDDDSDHVQDDPNDDAPDGPNGQSVERRRGDWIRSFSLRGSSLFSLFPSISSTSSR